MPTAVSLFTGCGGSDAGVVELGIDILMANDIVPYAAEFYAENWPETDYKVGDIRNLDCFPSADLLIGCYPCQGYSQGGARKSDRKVNFLFQEFGRALRNIKPKAFIVENVSGLLRADNRNLFWRQVRNFRAAGYRVKHSILDAANYGVPQNRKRIFIVGVRSDIGYEYEFPAASHGEGTNQNVVTIREALRGMEAWPDGEFNNEPFHWYYMSRNRRCDWNETSKTIVSRARHTPLHPCSPELVKTGPDCYEFTEQKPARRFSYREAAVLQGFPSDIRFPDSRGMHSRYKIIGNAVPPQLFRAVASKLIDIL